MKLGGCTIARIETPRLVKRGWHEAHIGSSAATVAVPRFVGGVVTLAGAWRGMAILGHWTLRGYGTWAVEPKSDGQLAGRIGLRYPEGWPGLQVIWSLARPFWGFGYATEAAAAAMRFGFEHTSEAQLISLMHRENHAASAVAQRIGQTIWAKRRDIVRERFRP